MLLYKLFFSLFLMSGWAFAAPDLTFTGTSTDLEVGQVTVKVFPAAKLDINKTVIPLSLTGSGIRKKVFVLPVPFYGITSYISTDLKAIDPSQGRDAVLNAIDSAPYKALQLTINFGLTADQIRNVFSDALDFNGVETKTGPIQQLLAQIKADTVPGDVITISGFPVDADNDVVTIDMLLQNDSDGNPLAKPAHTILTAKGAKLSSQFWKVWFGKTLPDDDYMVQLQDDLINQIIKK